MEKFWCNRVTKNNSTAKTRQFSLWARKEIDEIFFPDFSQTFKVFFKFPQTFPGFPYCSQSCKLGDLKEFMILYCNPLTYFSGRKLM